MSVVCLSFGQSFRPIVGGGKSAILQQLKNNGTMYKIVILLVSIIRCVCVCGGGGGGGGKGSVKLIVGTLVVLPANFCLQHCLQLN